jgi:hypothetical protein
MTGFIGFVANVLNRRTDGGTVSVRKSASEKELFSSACEYVKLQFSLRVPKNRIFYCFNDPLTGHADPTYIKLN